MICFGMEAKTGLPVIFLMGPTASGKTKLAVELCQHLPLDIVSVDSAMIYRGMDIGTAKPSAEMRRIAPHRLIDICDPAESYSAARFRSDALTEIEDIHSSDRIPLLVGGTGLYFRSLEKGITDLPSASVEVRDRLLAEARTKSWKALHKQLAEIDPIAATRIHPNDTQRIQRALEVYALTGRSMSEHYARETAMPLSYKVIKILTSPQDRSFIHAQVRLRFLEMLEAGLIDEVKGLYERGDLTPEMPSMRLVGYRQVWRYLGGLLDHDRMVEDAIVATRQLAKRQLTWLRKEQGTHWFDGQDNRLLDNILKFLGGDRNLLPGM
ncbi:MAG: tRNA dimethylallyltransferase [Gammaproteobacteria bacterium]|nr:tRNA dimethylallyltransferase [Gammaproteobacteria bacterium]